MSRLPELTVDDLKFSVDCEGDIEVEIENEGDTFYTWIDPYLAERLWKWLEEAIPEAHERRSELP
jgi:hypothetical protein